MRSYGEQICKLPTLKNVNIVWGDIINQNM